MSESKLTQVQDQNQTAKTQQVETQQVEQVQTAVSNGHVLKREHLLHGARRELRKMERLVKESDFELER